MFRVQVPTNHEIRVPSNPEMTAEHVQPDASNPDTLSSQPCKPAARTRPVTQRRRRSRRSKGRVKYRIDTEKEDDVSDPSKKIVTLELVPK